MKSSTRRVFLGQAASVGLATALPWQKVWANSPSEQVNVGVVGCGGRGGGMIDTFRKLPGAKITALCDADQARLDKVSHLAPDAKQYIDMRELYDSPEIDAVVIVTSNHWHCLAAIWAMQAGKHVYVEKPLGQSHWEGRQVVNAAAKYNRVCQIGTQQRSDPMQAEIKNFLHQEKSLGDILAVRVNRVGVRKSIGLREKPLEIPKTVDYDLWLGPAQDEPIYRNSLHYDWHWCWNTGSGEMGNWGVHILDDVSNNVFLDKVATPTNISAAGGRFGWNDAGDTPNVHYAQFDAAGVPVVFSLCNLPLDNTKVTAPGPQTGYIVYCSEGRYEGQRGSGEAFDADGNLIKKFSGNMGNVIHQQNFIDAVRANDASLLNAPVKIGQDSTSWSNVVNIATKLAAKNADSYEPADSAIGSDSAAEIYGQMQQIAKTYVDSAAEEPMPLGPTLMFDTESDQFVGDHAELANPLLRRVDREPYVVPEISAT